MWQYDEKTKAFIPGKLPAGGKEISILYARLSQEDTQEGDSESITNQLDFLLRYATEHRLPNPRFFYDDGYTGTNFDRPAFQEAMDLVESGRVLNFVVKDHSRLGRNRLAVGLLMERFTEEYDVRYIAVADNIDSAKGFDDMVAFRELFNEFYPRDTSKKIRAVITSKGNSGQRLCTQVPYGYTGNKYQWNVDEDAAQVVRKIFSLCMAGLGPTQIAKRLKAEKVLTPTAHKQAQGVPNLHQPNPDPYGWSCQTVSSILERMEYLGCTVNFKTRKKSYKSKKTLYLPKDEWKIFPDTHPAIIDQETWERVQELRKNKRRPTKTGIRGLFSGLAYCADCGGKLYFCTAYSLTENQNHYVCSHYKSNTGTCSIHFIREKVLTELVLNHLRMTIGYVRKNTETFAQQMMDKTAQEHRRELARKKLECNQAEQRVKELDKLFQRIYEDNAMGKLSDRRFEQLSSAYELEQKELEQNIIQLRQDLEKGEKVVASVDEFIALAQRYTEVRELTPTILHEFVEKVVIHAPTKVNGHRLQKVQIFYNFIGEFSAMFENSKTA